jgi:hypothetical protein
VVAHYCIAFFSEKRLALAEVFRIHCTLFQLAGKGYNFLCQCVPNKFVMPLGAVAISVLVVVAEIVRVVVDLYDGLSMNYLTKAESGLNMLGRC